MTSRSPSVSSNDVRESVVITDGRSEEIREYYRKVFFDVGAFFLAQPRGLPWVNRHYCCLLLQDSEPHVASSRVRAVPCTFDLQPV
jgi:hypothetical protein